MQQAPALAFVGHAFLQREQIVLVHICCFEVGHAGLHHLSERQLSISILVGCSQFSQLAFADAGQLAEVGEMDVTLCVGAQAVPALHDVLVELFQRHVAVVVEIGCRADGLRPVGGGWGRRLVRLGGAGWRGG